MFDGDLYSQHKQRIQDHLAGRIKPFFKVLAPCRLDNQGIIALPNVQAPTRKIFGFIPAAGAATRYLSALHPLLALEAHSSPEVVQATKDTLLQAGARHWPLPKAIQDFFLPAWQLTPESLLEIRRWLSSPKAMFPCGQGEHSFLSMKYLEYESLGNIHGQVYVSPLGFKTEFEKILARMSAKNTSAQISVFDQGISLSTLRFCGNGSPYMDDQGSVSLVSAGHGALVHLYPELKKAHPSLDAIFVRNVDNVVGTTPEVVKPSQKVIEFYNWLFQRFASIRKFLAKQNIPSAKNVVAEMLSLWPEHFSPTPISTLNQKYLPQDASQKPLWEFITHVLHTTLERPLDEASLQRIFHRPLNLLGMVPNTGNDVGGTPVFAEVEGTVQKLCIELPHVSPEEQKSITCNPAQATHFNPVHVLAEVREDLSCFEVDRHPFWVISKKNFRKEVVYYHESILYELLGSSRHCNTIFVEIPRILFNPRKTL